MLEEKIIIKIPEELKNDLSNTKSLDGEEKESFFGGIDLFGETKIANFSITNFENEWNYNLDIYEKLLTTWYLTPSKAKQLKQVKSRLYYLELFYKNNFGEEKFYRIFSDFTFENSKYFNTNINKELNSIFTSLDRFYLSLFRYKNNSNKFNSFILLNKIKSLLKRDKEKIKLILKSSFINIYTNSLEIINKDVVEQLKEFKGIFLYLNGIKSLDEKVAGQLKGLDGRFLYLNGLRSLDEKVAGQLKEFGGNLSLDGLKKIDKEVAEQLKGVGGSLFLNGLKSLNKETAIELNEFKGGNLSLNGLRSLSKGVARQLKGFEGGVLSLNGLRSLSKGVARQLKGFDGRFLYLNGLRSLSKGVARQLKGFEGEILVLNGLKSLDKGVTRQLKKFKGNSLSLNGLKRLDKEVAGELKEFGGNLYLNGLKSLDKGVTRQLKKFKGNSLSLNGLKRLDKEVAGELKEFGGNLYLNGLKSLDKEVAGELKNFKGDALSLDGLKSLDKEVAGELKEFKGSLSLNGLKYIKTNNNLSPQKQEIKEFINDFKSGSCLVSGYRGIGKTSTIKSCINEFKKENKNINTISIIINVPERSKDGFDKNELINRIIVKIFEEIDSNRYLPKSFKNKIFEQYQRVYHSIENTNKTSIESKENKINLNIKNIILLGLAIGVLSIFYKNNFNIISAIPTGLGAIVLGKITSFFYDIYEEKQVKEQTIKELYSADIAETRLVSNISDIMSGNSIKELFNNIWNKLLGLPDFIKNNYLKITTASLSLIIFWVVSFYTRISEIFNFSQIGVWFDNNYSKQIGFSLGRYISKIDGHIFIFILFIIILIVAIKIWNQIFYKPTKFIFVIDELDKLLDFEKVSGEKNDGKQKVDMKQVFEVLGKLKTLFFETNGALFFVVTNKQAYDYYLQNKHQEDDVISNIFNKIIYIPANSIDNFNINHKVEIIENAKGKKEKDMVIENENETRFPEKRILVDKLKKYIYFKSHGNWRKSRFELSNMMKGNQIEIDSKSLNFEYKFYDFFDKLYQTFEKGSLEKFDEKKDIFEDFLFSMNKEKSGYVNKMFDEEYKIDGIQEKNNETIKNNIVEQITNDSKVEIEKLRKEMEKKFYSIYLLKVKDLIKTKKKELGIDENTDLFVQEYLEYISKIFISEGFNKRKFFSFFVASVEKISKEYAYRDYVLNYLLNIYENIKFLRKTTLDEIFKNIKINEDDLIYPAFTDLILYWLPLMLIYFTNINTDEQ